MPSVSARLFNRVSSRFQRLYVRLRVNKDMATGSGYGYGEYAGQQMMVIQLPPGQTANAVEIQDYTGAVPATGNVLGGFDAAGNLLYGGVNAQKACCLSIPLTAAQIIAMGTTPITIVPAPGTGFAILVEQITVELDLSATAFTSGGVVHFYYHGQTTEVMAQSIAAATVQGGAGTSVYLLEPAQTAGGSVITPAVGLDITNATAAFATGTGTAIVTVWYSLLTL